MCHHRRRGGGRVPVEGLVEAGSGGDLTGEVEHVVLRFNTFQLISHQQFGYYIQLSGLIELCGVHSGQGLRMVGLGLGATWHAAGLVTRFAGSSKLKKVSQRRDIESGERERGKREGGDEKGRERGGYEQDILFRLYSQGDVSKDILHVAVSLFKREQGREVKDYDIIH
eukprot:313026-Amorphochlora_amoeboformis.AAC.1